MFVLDFKDAFYNVYHSTGFRTQKIFSNLLSELENTVIFEEIFDRSAFDKIIDSCEHLTISPLGFARSVYRYGDAYDWDLAFTHDAEKIACALELIFDSLERIVSRKRHDAVHASLIERRMIRRAMSDHGLLQGDGQAAILEALRNISSKKRSLIIAVGNYKEFTERLGYNKNHKRRDEMIARVSREPLTINLVKFCQRGISAHFKSIQARLAVDFSRDEADDYAKLMEEIIETLDWAEMELLMSEEGEESL